MAQRKNKERKQNLLKYKKSKQMSESKAPEMRPFRQVPNWSSTEKFEVSGEEFGALYNFFNIFAPAYTAIQQVFARGYKAGKVTVNYEDMEGNPIHDDEINAYTERLNAHFQKETEKKEQETGKIVSFTGEKLSKEDFDAVGKANEAYSEIQTEG
jgi:hypothetical protein